MMNVLSPSAASSEAVVIQQKTPQRLPFLDGIRGLAALYVLLFHSLTRVTEKPEFGRLPSLLEYATRWALHGHFAVDVFIVLSGYCLMLPVARSRNDQLQGGLLRYFKRRARRILPPYYAALSVSILLLLLGVLAHARLGYRSTGGSIAPWELSPGCLLSHLVLMHNLKREWGAAYDPALWSIATEWQIYFLFPLALLPVWRRFGNIMVIAVGFGIGLLPHFLLPPPLHLVWASPWYVGLFATGMAGAALSVSTQPRLSRWYARCPWGAISVVLAVAACALIGRLPHELCIAAADTPLLWITDALTGFATTCLILALTRSRTRLSTASRPALQQQGQGVGNLVASSQPILLRLLESRPVTSLGAFSYSLYLIHQPLTFRVIRILELLHLPVAAMLLLDWCLGVPCILGLAYLFYLAAERRWLASSRQSSTPAQALTHPL